MMIFDQAIDVDDDENDDIGGCGGCIVVAWLIESQNGFANDPVVGRNKTHPLCGTLALRNLLKDIELVRDIKRLALVQTVDF